VLKKTSSLGENIDAAVLSYIYSSKMMHEKQRKVFE